MRDVRNALFGQQLQLHNWKIAAHITHGAMSTYNEIVENMKSKVYEELTVPIKDRIGSEAKVLMSIECCDPWQMGLRKAVTHIPTRHFLNSRKDATCYYVSTVQDREESSNTLQCTVAVEVPPRFTEITTGKSIFSVSEIDNFS